jgi:hypothetical protein
LRDEPRSDGGGERGRRAGRHGPAKALLNTEHRRHHGRQDQDGLEPSRKTMIALFATTTA